MILRPQPPLLLQSLLDRPLRNLCLLFLVWKGLLLSVALCSPGPGYDTSTSTALLALTRQTQTPLPLPLHHVAEKLTRWDAIYFVTTANRGYLFEQEWAFGWGFARLVALCTSALPAYDGLEALVAVSIAHLSHLFAVIVLFKLTLAIFGREAKRTAFTAALLHIISPAGIFLSAPYAESSCAFLTFAGCLNFAKSFAGDGRPSASRDLLLILTGVLFGAATSFRSNGILSGLLLLEEAFRLLFQLRNGLKFAIFRRLLAAGLGGLLVAAGFMLPQLIAYREYCQRPSGDQRPWCSKIPPSIYTFVQDHYWDVGFLRYWTFSNLPLFLLAAPMFCILILSGRWAWSYSPRTTSADEKKPKPQADSGRISDAGSINLLRSLGVSQLLLTLLTLSTAHVQIITRISSAYPVWLWYLAVLSQRSNAWLVGPMVQFMVMYAVIQGGLFASFLPPA